MSGGSRQRINASEGLVRREPFLMLLLSGSFDLGSMR